MGAQNFSAGTGVFLVSNRADNSFDMRGYVRVEMIQILLGKMGHFGAFAAKITFDQTASYGG